MRLLLVLLALASLPLAAADRPNLILILADDLGYEGLSANGSADCRTPRLDRLAAEGVRFEHCYAQPLCTPTRVQLMTGLYNVRNYTVFGELNSAERTFANHLRDAGYATCMVGKWQLGGGLDAPRSFGFDESLLWQLDGPRQTPDGRDHRYPGPVLTDNGKTTEHPADAYGPDLLNARALDFIRRQHQAERPFFLYYSMLLTHCPFSPTPDSEEWPAPEVVRDYKGKPEFFADMAAYADKMVGNLLDELDRLGARDDTLIVFLGDNGTDEPIVTTMTDGRRIAGAKGKTTDGGTHVPLIASWPAQVEGGRLSEALVDTSDFMPTLLDAAGLPVPDDLDGRSFLPVLRAERKHVRDWTYCWYSPSGRPREAKVFARDQRWKLYSDGRLFDIPADPLEKHPLKKDDTPEAAAARQKLLPVIESFASVRAAK